MEYKIIYIGRKKFEVPINTDVVAWLAENFPEVEVGDGNNPDMLSDE